MEVYVKPLPCVTKYNFHMIFIAVYSRLCVKKCILLDDLGRSCL